MLNMKEDNISLLDDYHDYIMTDTKVEDNIRELFYLLLKQKNLLLMPSLDSRSEDARKKVFATFTDNKEQCCIVT